MKKNIRFMLASVCLLTASLFFNSCQKDIRQSSPASPAATTVSSAKMAAARSSDEGGYTFTDITVTLNDEGRSNLLKTGFSEMVQTGENAYRTIQGNGGTTNPGPGPQPEPILCDGMTYSQVWADISQKYNAFVNSPAGQALQARANATCKPQFFGVCNCAICMLCVMQPNRPCSKLEEYIKADRINAQLIAREP